MRKILLIITAALAAVSVLMAHRTGDSDADARARAAMAAWLAIESENAVAQEDIASALTLLDIAHTLYPKDRDISGSRARLRVMLNYFDANEVQDLSGDLLLNIYAHPEDILLGKLNYRYINYLSPDWVTLGVARTLYEHHPTDPEIALTYAQALAARGNDGDIDSALAIVDPIMAADIDPALVYYKARLLAMQNDTAAVSSTLRYMLKDAPDDPERLNGIASFYNFIKMPDSAYIYNVRAHEADSAYGPALVGIAQYNLEQGDTLGFEHSLEKALLTSTMDWEDKMQLIGPYLSAHSARDSSKLYPVEFLKRLSRLHSTEPEIYRVRGGFYALLDSMPQAIEDLSLAVDLDPENGEAYSLLARVYTDSGDTIAGINTMMRGLENTGDPVMAFNAAIWDLMINRPAEGITHLRAIKDMSALNDKGKSQYYNILGDLYHGIGNDSAAVAVLDSAIMLDPTAYGAYNNAAYYRAVGGYDLEKAESYARIAVSGDLTNPTYLDTYAWVLFKRKDFQGARIQIDLALQAYAMQDTATVEAVEEWTDVTDKFTGAEEVVEGVVESNADYQPSAEVYDHAGDIYFMVGEPAQALEFWKKALLIEPENRRIKKKVDHKTYFPDESE